MKLVRIEAGEFRMGTTKSQVDQLMGFVSDVKREDFDNEQPQHAVTISRRFYLGIHEVTQGQYLTVTGRNPSRNKGSDNLPVDNVSWFDASEFCNKLSARENRPLHYRINGENVSIAGGTGYRLPTEAEWEYASRAGSAAIYPFGNGPSELSRYAWYDKNSGAKTHPIGQKLPNAWGLYDMLGNVWEWCGDGYDAKYYASSPSVDPPGAAGASSRAFRGGGWLGDSGGCRPASRFRLSPGIRNFNLGFRVAATQG
jgi:formylglycine-generating enzyme required for sulfatase activity